MIFLRRPRQGVENSNSGFVPASVTDYRSNRESSTNQIGHEFVAQKFFANNALLIELTSTAVSVIWCQFSADPYVKNFSLFPARHSSALNWNKRNKIKHCEQRATQFVTYFPCFSKTTKNTFFFTAVSVRNLIACTSRQEPAVLPGIPFRASTWQRKQLREEQAVF